MQLQWFENSRNNIDFSFEEADDYFLIHQLPGEMMIHLDEHQGVFGSTDV